MFCSQFNWNYLLEVYCQILYAKKSFLKNFFFFFWQIAYRHILISDLCNRRMPLFTDRRTYVKPLYMLHVFWSHPLTILFFYVCHSFHSVRMTMKLMMISKNFFDNLVSYKYVNLFVSILFVSTTKFSRSEKKNAL